MNRRSFLTLTGASLLTACADDLLGPTRIYMNPRLTAAGATVKVLNNQAYAAKILFNPATGYDVQGCYFHMGYGVSSGRWSHWSGNVVRIVTGFEVVGAGDMSDTVFLNAWTQNPHFLKPAAGIPADLIFDGMVFEYLGTDGNGDCFMLPPKPVGQRHYTLSHALCVPNAAGNDSGVLVSQLGGPTVAVSVLQSTALMGTGGGLGGGETCAGYAGMYRAIDGNIFWDTKVRGYALNDQSSTGKPAATDLVLPSGWGSNVVWNAKAPSQWPLSFQPSVLSADPMFAYPASLRSFDASQGGVGTNASGCDRLLTQQAMPSDLLAYYRAGYTPTNPACQGYGAV